VERGALEAFATLDFRKRRHVQRAHAGDQHARTNAHSVPGRNVPHSFRFVPDGFTKASVESHIRSKAVLLDAALQIIVDFLLTGIHARPLGRRREGKRIKVRRNIASAARIAIVPPGAADVGALFDDEKRAHPGFEKLDTHAQARKAAADNEDIDAGDWGICGIAGKFGHALVITSFFVCPGATRARRKSALSWSDWRASGTRWGTSCQACGTTGQIFRSTRTPAARARSARRVESSRRTSSAPTWIRSGGRPARSAYKGDARGSRGSVSPR